MVTSTARGPCGRGDHLSATRAAKYASREALARGSDWRFVLFRALLGFDRQRGRAEAERLARLDPRRGTPSLGRPGRAGDPGHADTGPEDRAR